LWNQKLHSSGKFRNFQFCFEKFDILTRSFAASLDFQFAVEDFRDVGHGTLA
jgi:hypothetical protein